VIPEFQALMLPVLRSSENGEVKISDVARQLEDELHLSPDERTQFLKSGQTRFENRVYWAKSYLGQAGLVDFTKRAHFCISKRGKDVLIENPERIDIKYLSQFPEFRAFRQRTHKAAEADDPVVAAEVSTDVPDGASSLTLDEVMRQAHGQLESSLAAELLQRLQTGTPKFFEKAVVLLLVGMGYGGGSVIDLEKALVGGSGDGGIDGVIDQDLLGLDRIYMQAKRYADGNPVGPGAIRDFFGSLDMRRASKGVFVTASTFSSQASETVKQLGKRIVLIDGVQLARLMIRHHVGCRVEETLPIMEIDEEFFE
jgi:restriction system protein